MALLIGDPNNISVFGFKSGGGVNLVSTFGYIGGEAIDSIIITDHISRMKSLLIEQFKRSPRLNQKIEIVGTQIQELELQFSKLLKQRTLGQASGAQLDGIGEVVDEPRNGRSDEDYLDAILIRIYLNSASGEPESLIAACLFITVGTRVKFWELKPAAIQMYTNGVFVPQSIAKDLDSIAAGGVKVLYVSSSEGTTPFAFANDDGSTPEIGLGLNEYNYTPGGNEVGGQIVEGYINT